MFLQVTTKSRAHHRQCRTRCTLLKPSHLFCAVRLLINEKICRLRQRSPSIDVFRVPSQHRCFSCSFSTSMFFVLILSTDVLRVPSQHRCFTCSFSASTFYMLLLSIDVLHAPSQHRRFTCSFPASTFYMLLLS